MESVFVFKEKKTIFTHWESLQNRSPFYQLWSCQLWSCQLWMKKYQLWSCKSIMKMVILWTEVQEVGECSSSKILLWYVSPHKKVSSLLRDKELWLVGGVCVCSWCYRENAQSIIGRNRREHTHTHEHTRTLGNTLLKHTIPALTTVLLRNKKTWRRTDETRERVRASDRERENGVILWDWSLGNWNLNSYRRW